MMKRKVKWKGLVGWPSNERSNILSIVLFLFGLLLVAGRPKVLSLVLCLFLLILASLVMVQKKILEFSIKGRVGGSGGEQCLV